MLSNCSSSDLWSFGRWFLFVLSVLVTAQNLFSLLRTGFKYNQAKVEKDKLVYRRNKVQKKLVDLENGLESNIEDETSNNSEVEFKDFPQECRRYTYLFVCTLFASASSVIEIAGCWNTLFRNRCPQMTKVWEGGVSRIRGSPQEFRFTIVPK